MKDLMILNEIKNTEDNIWLDKESSIICQIRNMQEFAVFRRGWGNGYIGLPKNHPWYNIPYNDINDILYKNKIGNIHGGITFAEKIKDYWVIGFDTAHSDNNIDTWNKEAVKEETIKLLNIAKNVLRKNLLTTI